MWVAVCSIMMGSLGYWLQQYRGKCLLFVRVITFFGLAVQLLSIGKQCTLGQDEIGRMPFYCESPDYRSACCVVLLAKDYDHLLRTTPCIQAHKPTQSTHGTCSHLL